MKPLKPIFTMTFTLTAALAISACTDLEATQADVGELSFAAGQSTWGGETGWEGGEEESSSSANPDVYGALADDDTASDSGDGDGDGDGDTSDLGESVDDAGESALPEAGFCTDGAEVIGTCLTSNELFLPCTPAYIATCESDGHVFKETEPDAIPTDADCDDYNDYLVNCTGGWLALCGLFGGDIECHAWEGDICVEATCKSPFG